MEDVPTWLMMLLMTTGSTSNTALISFNKKNTKAKLYWDKDSDNSLSKADPLIGKFKVKKNVSKEIWGNNNGNYAWSGLFSINKKGGISFDFSEYGVMKGKISKKHKEFYGDPDTYENQQKCKGDGTILDNCNPLETVLRGQGNNDALNALNTIENEVNYFSWLGIPTFWNFKIKILWLLSSQNIDV